MVNSLAWPLLIQYPEVGQTDLITDCFETTPLKDLLKDLLAHPSDWDKQNLFR